MQHGHGNRGHETDRKLVFDEVGHRIHAGHLSGVVGSARCRTHVKAGHRDDQSSGGKSGDTEAHEHRIHRHHQEHGQTRSARNEQVSHGTHDVTQSEHEIGGLEDAQRTGDVIGHQSACADLGHVGGIARGGHDQQTDAGHAGAHQGGDAFKEVKAHETRARNTLGKNLSTVGEKPKRIHGQGTDQQNQAAEEEHELGFHLLEQNPDHQDGDCK